MSVHHFNQWIVSDSEVLSGNPVIAGRTVTVSWLQSRAYGGQTLQEIADDLDLPLEAVVAAQKLDLVEARKHRQWPHNMSKWPGHARRSVS